MTRDDPSAEPGGDRGHEPGGDRSHEAGDGSDHEPSRGPGRLGVDGSADIGSRRLAEALAAADAVAVGRALRHDVVVVPVVADRDGRPRNRVFAVAGSQRCELALFSSTATLSTFLRDDDERGFVLSSGEALRDQLLARHELLTSVVFDPAGPRPVTASVDDLIAALQPQPDDDEVAWAISGAAVDAEAPETGTGGAGDLGADTADIDVRRGAAPAPVTALDVALHRDWSPVALGDAATRDVQTEALAARHLPRGERDGLSEAAFTRWLHETSDRAGTHGRFLAFLLRRSRLYPVAFGLTMYWFPLGPATDRGHLPRVTDVLRASLGDGDELASATAPAGAFVRHSWTLREGALGPLALVDYWFAFPDGNGLCLLTFCTPQPRLRGTLQAAADRVALSGRWVRGR